MRKKKKAYGFVRNSENLGSRKELEDGRGSKARGGAPFTAGTKLETEGSKKPLATNRRRDAHEGD